MPSHILKDSLRWSWHFAFTHEEMQTQRGNVTCQGFWFYSQVLFHYNIVPVWSNGTVCHFYRYGAWIWKGKTGRTKKQNKTKQLQKVINTLHHESGDHLLNFNCWKWIFFFCRILKSCWGYQVWQQLPKIKYQTSKHLTAQESSIFLCCDFCQNCAWHFQAWKCLSTILPFNPCLGL